MGKKTKAEKQAAIKRYEKAMDDLEDCPGNGLDEEFNRRNTAVVKAMRDVPWWRR